MEWKAIWKGNNANPILTKWKRSTWLFTMYPFVGFLGVTTCLCSYVLLIVLRRSRMILCALLSPNFLSLMLTKCFCSKESRRPCCFLWFSMVPYETLGFPVVPSPQKHPYPLGSLQEMAIGRKAQVSPQIVIAICELKKSNLRIFQHTPQ